MTHTHPCDICGQPVECDGPVTGGDDPMDATCVQEQQGVAFLCSTCMYHQDEVYDRR